MATTSDTTSAGLLDAAPDAIVCVDASGVIVLVNAQAERLFGWQRGELVGQPIEVLVPEQSQHLHPTHRSRYLSDPVPRPMGAGMQLAARRKSGSEFPAEISLNTLETEDGTLVAAAIRDATDRRRAEAKFRGLLEAAPDAMICVEPTGRISLANAQAVRLFGYTREEMIGQPVDLLVPEHARARHPSHRREYVRAARPRPMGLGMQLAGRRKDGSEFPAEISLNTLETEDGVLVTAAIRDVTERLEAQAERERLKAQADRERIEAQLQQSQRLESLGQLAGGVAHDFNNLLGAILNYASFVEDEVNAAAAGDASRPWDVVQSDVQQIRRAASRAAELTHQLLSFARREVVRPQVINLNEVVSEVEDLLQRTIGEHVELVTQLADDLSATTADPGQIEQVLVNLAVNARDAMPEGGRLTIETANVDVDEAYRAGHMQVTLGPYVRLRVSDTGVGMPPDVVSHAFEPFYTTKPKGEGTGLGLATVYGIVTQADGAVQIYSEPGMGTTVNVLLPTTEAPDHKPEVRPPAIGATAGETVLIVEDDEFMRETTTRILIRSGYRVLTARNGGEALAAAAEFEGPIHLLLTDVVMPGLLGKEVAERLVDMRSDTRVIFMSGYAQAMLGAKNSLEPGTHLIEKPFSEALLLAKLREVLDGGR